MNVLVGCEESQVVTGEFRLRGHDAYSCDIIPTRGNKFWHFQQDIVELLKGCANNYWDLIILHLDCTKLSLSGNRWYGRGTPRHQERLDAINWSVSTWELAVSKSKRTVLENPLSVIFQYIMCDRVQYIQPHQFGHGETKKTGLAQLNVPPLKPTNDVSGREQRVWKMPPGPNRKRDRAETYVGVAKAMADQWGSLI